MTSLLQTTCVILSKLVNFFALAASYLDGSSIGIYGVFISLKGL